MLLHLFTAMLVSSGFPRSLSFWNSRLRSSCCSASCCFFVSICIIPFRSHTLSLKVKIRILSNSSKVTQDASSRGSPCRWIRICWIHLESWSVILWLITAAGCTTSWLPREFEGRGFGYCRGSPLYGLRSEIWDTGCTFEVWVKFSSKATGPCTELFDEVHNTFEIAFDAFYLLKIFVYKVGLRYTNILLCIWNPFYEHLHSPSLDFEPWLSLF